MKLFCRKIKVMFEKIYENRGNFCTNKLNKK